MADGESYYIEPLLEADEQHLVYRPQDRRDKKTWGKYSKKVGKEKRSATYLIWPHDISSLLLSHLKILRRRFISDIRLYCVGCGIVCHKFHQEGCVIYLKKKKLNVSRAVGL